MPTDRQRLTLTRPYNLIYIPYNIDHADCDTSCITNYLIASHSHLNVLSLQVTLFGIHLCLQAYLYDRRV